MPRGFPQIESGSDLPARLMKVADRLKIDLKTARERPERTVSEANPISSEEIRAGYLKWHKWAMSSADLRAVVNYLRREGVPIGSGSKGYWYCLSAEEWKTTDQHLTDRIAGEVAARSGVRNYFRKVAADQTEIPFAETKEEKS